MMEQYNVTGMTCSACSARVEKAVLKVDGVTSCAVSLLTNSMGVEGTAAPDKIIAAVQKAGYGASLKNKNKEASSSEDALEDRETPLMKKRFIASLVFLIPLMYISMGHMMWDWPLPPFLDGNHVAMGLIQLLLTAVIMVINQKFFINGFKSLIHGSPNMDALVALGSGAAFIYSTYALFAMTGAQLSGNSESVMTYMEEFYFESSAMILTIITLGKMLESYSKGKTTDAIKGLIRLSPKTAVIISGGKEVRVSADEVKKGDIFVVRPGEGIPVDGIVTDGSSAVNEAALTGESIPVDKSPGDNVYAASLNVSGFIKCEAVKVGEDTTLSQIIRMVSDAAATKAPIAKAADKVAGIFVPAVMLIAVVTFAVWMTVGGGIGFSLARGISVLVISCPCALGLATPVAIMVGNGIGARNGILFKNAQLLEETGKAQIVVLDKTGTVTSGEPTVTDIITAEGVSEHELLKAAYSLEKKSGHPLAKAIITKAESMNISSDEASDFKSVSGSGLSGTLHGNRLYAGNYKYVSGFADINEDMRGQAERLAESGKTPMFFAENNRLIGITAVADTIKEDSPGAVRELQGMGIRVVMLTGDNERTAREIGRQAGVDDVIAGVFPDGKENVIRELKNEGKVIMVGDGINDAPALTRADTGIAIGAGTDIAIDAADVVLMKSRLSDVPAAIRLSRKTLKNIYENLFWAFIYNIIGIPLAAGVWINIFGWQLNPMFAALAMSLSSVCVVSNALRLNLADIYSTKHDRKLKSKRQRQKNKINTTKEHGTMKRTIKIEGMMCEHCEKHVREALERLDGVDEAVVSHKSGTAEVSLNSAVSDDTLRAAVEEQDYKVLGFGD